MCHHHHKYKTNSMLCLLVGCLLLLLVENNFFSLMIKWIKLEQFLLGKFYFIYFSSFFCSCIVYIWCSFISSGTAFQSINYGGRVYKTKTFKTALGIKKWKKEKAEKRLGFMKQLKKMISFYIYFSSTVESPAIKKNIKICNRPYIELCYNFYLMLFSIRLHKSFCI